MEAELYVVCIVDKNYDFVRYVVGCGSSTKPSIKAHDNEKSANRALGAMKSRTVLGEGEQLMVLKFEEAK